MKNLVPAILGLLGVILGITASALWQWTEHEERYREMMFEKRLSVHQEAFVLTSEIAEKCNLVVIGKRMPSQDELNSDLREMSTWWRANCLYLDRASRKSFINLISGVRIYAQSYDHKEAEKCLDLAQITGRKIVEGIGEEYLPEMELIGEME